MSRAPMRWRTTSRSTTPNAAGGSRSSTSTHLCRAMSGIRCAPSSKAPASVSCWTARLTSSSMTTTLRARARSGCGPRPTASRRSTTLSGSRRRSLRARASRRAVQPRGQTSPAVAQRAGRLDFGEGRIELAELLSDALDRRANVGAIAVVAVPRQEAFVVLNVVDGAIGLVLADIRGQQLDDVVFAGGEADIGLLPIGSPLGRLQQQIATGDAVVGLGTGGRLVGHESQTPDQDLHAARLVHEVDGAPGKGLPFVGDLG